MFAHFTLRTNDENKIFFPGKKIGFDDSFDVTKCLQKIEIPDLHHMCALRPELPFKYHGRDQLHREYYDVKHFT